VRSPPSGRTTALDPWVAAAAEQIAARAPGELERLVAISSPSGDVAGADAALALVLELVPPGVRVERPPCSSSDHADDLIVTLGGSGSGRVVLLGHVDTVHTLRSPAVWLGHRVAPVSGRITTSTGSRTVREEPDAMSFLSCSPSASPTTRRPPQSKTCPRRPSTAGIGIADTGVHALGSLTIDGERCVRVSFVGRLAEVQHRKTTTPTAKGREKAMFEINAATGAAVRTAVGANVAEADSIAIVPESGGGTASAEQGYGRAAAVRGGRRRRPNRR